MSSPPSAPPASASASSPDDNYAASSASQSDKNSTPGLKSPTAPQSKAPFKHSFFSTIIFSWMSKWIYSAYSKTVLTAADLFPLPADADSATLFAQFQAFSAKKGSPLKIDTMVSAMFGPYQRAVAICQCTETFLKIIGCFIVYRFIESLNVLKEPGDNMRFLNPFLLACAIVVLLIINSAAHHQVFWRGGHLGMLVRATLSSAIFNKLTHLSLGASDAAAGEILNMISNDVGKMEEYATFSHFKWFAPLEVVIVCIFVYVITRRIDIALVILLVFSLMIGMQFLLSRRTSFIRSKVVGARDEMIKYMTDLLMGMQIVKYYAWESSFNKRIQGARDCCMNWLWKAASLKAFNSIMYYVANDALTLVIIGFAAFFVDGDKGNRLNAGMIVSSRMMFASIILVICNFFPRGVELYVESKISIQRIEKFLNQEEIVVRDEVGDPKGNLIAFSEACFGEPDQPAVLGPLTLEARAGELVMVVGPVGCGKSALLASVLGEIKLASGTLAFKGPVAYASQQPWLMNCSIRENIVLGKIWDPLHYKRVLDACCLTSDLQGMPRGDATIVGERGSALSGGQRARVSLARALYFKEASIYLLDDVLSAVDTTVGNAMVQAIRKMLGSTKLCILVTHQLQFVRFATQVVVLEPHGHVPFVGPYEELSKMGSKISFVATLQAYDSLEDDLIETVQQDEIEPDLTTLIYEEPSWLVGEAAEEPLLEEEASEDTADDDEGRSVGSVGFAVYRDFFGPAFWLLLLLVVVFLCAQILLVLFQKKVLDSLLDDDSIDSKIFYKASAFFAAELLLFTVGIFLFYRVCMNASRAIFRTILTSLLRSPMAFFQRQPLGRILNRFSKDQTAVDEQLFCNLSDAILLTFRTSICFIMTVTGSSWTSRLVLFFGFCLLAWRLSVLFRTFFKVSRDLKRIEAVTRSPLYAHIASCLEGLPQIRSHSLQPAMLKRHQQRQNTNTQALHAFLGASRWFSFTVDFSCCFFTLTYLFVALVMIKMGSGDLDGGDDEKKKAVSASIEAIVLCINYCQEIAESVQWTARLIADVEVGMTNVERVVEYTRIPHEAPAHMPQDKVLDPAWPSAGAISFQNVSVWYEGQGTPALSQIDCEITPGQRVALVGRTGAGKSSFLSALFRMAQCKEEECGAILIDGVPIHTLGLATLRSKLCIIPQEPYIFLGDLRFNLDPYSQHSDHELWRVLEIVQLKSKVSAIPLGLSTTTAKESMSLGERQLVCMARALLKSSMCEDGAPDGGVVVMDEATANIDLATSHAIQDAVKSLFSTRTLCTIAHRLHTIIDYDRIVVLDAGRIVEVGAPKDLLAVEGGFFAAMVAELGPEGEKRLREMAYGA